jgi:hypothetical protein
VKVVTWSRDSHGLFDYESKNVTKDTLSATSSCKLIRAGEEVRIVNDLNEQECNDEVKILCNINYREGKVHIGMYSLAPSNYKTNLTYWDPESVEKLWLSVKSLKTSCGIKGYQLAEGDVIKLGRVRFRVVELNASVKAYKPEPVNLAEMMLGKTAFTDSSEEEVTQEMASPIPCRVCLSELYDADNPLISPCCCDGTMKYIHLKCLQQWLKSKLVSRSSENAISLTWKTLTCELCKRTFPHRLGVLGKSVELVEIPKPRSNFLILESLHKDRNFNKGVHVVSLASKSVVRLGRGHDCDLRISDISVSRFHATFKLINGQFYLEDQNSKFGTLIYMKRPILIDSSSTVSVQAGRTLLSLSIKKPFSFIPSCLRSTTAAAQIDLVTEPTEPSILPYNNGIPLSISNFTELMNISNAINSGVPVRSSKKLGIRDALIGMNSSSDEEESDEEEVEIGGLNLSQAAIQIRNRNAQRLNHTISYQDMNEI